MTEEEFWGRINKMTAKEDNTNKDDYVNTTIENEKDVDVVYFWLGKDGEKSE